MLVIGTDDDRLSVKVKLDAASMLIKYSVDANAKDNNDVLFADKARSRNSQNSHKSRS